MPDFVFPDRLARVEADRHRRHVFSDEPPSDNFFSYHVPEVVIISVAALEAGVNEMAQRLSSYEKLELAPGFETMKIAAKWALLPITTVGKKFDRSASPWQDFDLLLKLRNAFVHYEIGKDRPTWMRGLTSRHLCLTKPGDWISTCLSSRVALWASNVVPDMFVSIESMLDKENAGDWPWSGRGFLKCDHTGKRVIPDWMLGKT
jgi:hypothetical protein